MNNVYIQCVGFVGLGIGVTSPLWPKRNQMLVVISISLLFYVAHYVLLETENGALLDSVSIIRILIALLFHGNLSLTLLCYSMPIIVFFIHHESLYTSLSVSVAALLNTHASFRIHPQSMRFFNALSSPFWFYYNYHIQSYPGMCGDVIGGTVALVGLLYYSNVFRDIKRQNLTKK